MDSKPTTVFTVCTCAACGGRIEFDADYLGTTVKCPHCNTDALLATMPAPKPVALRFAQAEAYTILKEGDLERRFEAAQESVEPPDKHIPSKLQGAGMVFSTLSAFGCIASLIVAAELALKELYEPAGILCAVGIVLGVQAFLVSALFNAMAEVIKMLQNLGGSKFKGSIFTIATVTARRCSLCRAEVQPSHKKCPRCDAELRWENT